MVTQYACPNCKSNGSIRPQEATLCPYGAKKLEFWCEACGWKGDYNELIPTFHPEHPLQKQLERERLRRRVEWEQMPWFKKIIPSIKSLF